LSARTPVKITCFTVTGTACKLNAKHLASPKAQDLCIHCELDASYAGYLSDTAPEQLQQLFDALDQEQAGDIVQYRDLFLEDNELNQVSQCILVSSAASASLCFDPGKMCTCTVFLTWCNTLFALAPSAVFGRSAMFRALFSSRCIVQQSVLQTSRQSSLSSYLHICFNQVVCKAAAYSHDALLLRVLVRIESAWTSKHYCELPPTLLLICLLNENRDLVMSGRNQARVASTLLYQMHVRLCDASTIVTWICHMLNARNSLALCPMHVTR